MRSYSTVVATLVFAAATCCPRICLSVGAQAAIDSGAAVKPLPATSADSAGGPGQSSSAPAAMLPAKAVVKPPAVASPLTPGIHIVAEFERTLNAKKLKPGDKVRAQLTQDVILHGKVVAPAESKLLGHVTESRGASDEDPSSRLGIVFDKILLKHHKELDFLGVIQALAPPGPRRSRVDEPDQMMPPMMGGGGSSSGSLQPPGSRSAPGGRSTSTNPGPVSSGPSSIAMVPVTAPIKYQTSPGIGPSDSTAAPISPGMPQGVFRLPGLALSATPTAETPGPVILSKSGSVKLEYGTQVLLRVQGPATPVQQEHSGP